MSVMVGADPEFFVKSEGAFVSACDMIPGTKHDPFKVKDGAVQVDGMALEINIDPASNSDVFVNNLNSVLAQLADMIPKGHEIVATPVATFTPEYMEKQPAFAKELGCDPDFNAYTGAANAAPNQHPTMRTAAGHVHIGWGECAMDDMHFLECTTLAKALDISLGMPSLLLDTSKESAMRRQMYGKAGCFRPKKYGMEYRVLSNFWLKDERLMRWVFNTVQATMDYVRDPSQHLTLYSLGFDDASDCINANIAEVAKWRCRYISSRMNEVAFAKTIREALELVGKV